MSALLNCPNQPSRTGGRLVVASLLAHGVDAVFCVPGESYLEIIDALYDVGDRIKLITCRHEHGAANMAEAYAKLTGKPGVCMVTRGPGACNAAIGAHTAFQDSTPMVLLIGQVARPHLGREAFQEVDFRRMFAPLTKWVEQVDDSGQLPTIMARAFHAAVSGRPGPVALALPEDMLREATDAPDVDPYQPTQAAPNSADMEAMRKLLAKSKRPMVMLGGGGWTPQARLDIASFVEANALPVCASFRCNDLLDNRSPGYAGEMGICPDPALIQRLKNSDLLLVVGARLGEKTTQSYTLIGCPTPAQTLIHVYPAVEELGRVFHPSLAIPSAMASFAAAAAALKPVDSREWRHWTKEAHNDYMKNLAPPPSGHPLDLGQIMVELDQMLPDDAIITVDAGNFSGWPQRFLTFGGQRRMLGPTSGAMGYGVPAAVAAMVAAPERCAVGMVGDGGFAMTGQELATAALYGVAPIILVFNNRMYGAIRMHQERRHPGRVIGTDLYDIDFAALAKAYGAHGERVERTTDFAPAFARARASGGPALIELVCDPEATTTRATLSAIRAAALHR